MGHLRFESRPSSQCPRVGSSSDWDDVGSRASQVGLKNASN